MLIRIDKSVVDLKDKDSLADEVILALEMLAAARREGKHAIIAERETLQALSQCKQLLKISRNIYLRLLNEFTKFRSLQSSVNTYVEVTNHCPEPNLVKISNKKILKVPPSFFNDSERIQKTILLCEHSNDALFYESVAKCYLRWNNRNIYISCEYRGGGGSTLANEYKNIQNSRNRFCLCIADSDRIAPGSRLGSTANKVRSEDNNNCILTEVFILEVREIENLIPLEILSASWSGNKNREDALMICEKILESSAFEMKFYLDLKQDTYMKDLVCSSDPTVKDFWTTKIRQVLDVSKGIDEWCLSNWKCSSSDDCKCKIPSGFGPNILGNTLEFMQSNSPHKLAKLVDGLHRLTWQAIGQEVVDWCFAESPIRA